ncbi:SMI1/KNR4 family protein [Flavobacterium hydatis]|uniref:SMI1/KNR4 family protein n=1 Tax=Flavobacterium hydatis TaxID=991 RepID=A0A086AT98_FLAHY|nr:SMI1/KNR4 family protein [Flavobacterium hydatis]KFF19912.1 hypothetical protein IW20_01935 [Flavobacterium hydatis]OXA91523.1 SMI1/KNR4 family protein [Flavobacterium hydatis]
MMKIEQMLEKHNFLKRTENSIHSIDEVENIIQFKLPQDYKLYISNYSGNENFIGEHFVVLWDLDEILEMNNNYEILHNLDNTIGIGSNGSSEFIAIEFIEKEKYRIVLSPFIDLDKDCHIDIGDSFTDFFDRLENGKNWFE